MSSDTRTMHKRWTAFTERRQPPCTVRLDGEEKIIGGTKPAFLGGKPTPEYGTLTEQIAEFEAAQDTKPSNPKDALGTTRVPLAIISDVADAEESLAFVEGMCKYGKHNYRVVGVRASIYLDAARRHLAKYVNGEDRDPKTGVHHLGSVRACMGIILETAAMGKLVDDRPPSNPNFSAYIDELEARVKHLREMFKDKDPKHYTKDDK